MKWYRKLRLGLQRLDQYRRSKLGNTEKSVYLLAMVAAMLAGGLTFSQLGLPAPWGFLLAAFLSLVAANAALGLACLTWRLLLRNGPAFFFCSLGCVALLATGLYTSCRGNIPYWATAVAAAAVVLVVRSLGQSVWAIFVNHRRGRAVVTMALVSGALTAALGLLLLGGGFDDDYVDDYLRLLETGRTAADPAPETGGYPVKTLYYGTGAADALESGTVNLGPYVGGYQGLQKWYRKLYQGYDIWSVPLRGKVWYPEGEENCPVLFIAHGNHNLTTDSYEGYDYLGEYLATKGYVAVSVDENALNWCVFGNLSGENDGRAVLLLENVRQLLQYSQEKTNPLYGLLDRERIALAGHSRGGETAATAALFCGLGRYPSNGNIPFTWDFSIRSVIAIAPTAGQYTPADHAVELKNVNYLLLQGANDQDVSVFMGARQYENVYFTGGDYLKSSLYIAGANHGQFNTRWGRFDLSGPLGRLLNVENLLTASEQQDILTTFAGVFLDVTLRGDETHRDLLYDYAAYAAHLPRTVYVQSYEDAGFRLLADFEEGPDLAYELDGRVRIRVQGADSWQESLAPYANPAMDDGDGLGTYVLNLDWGQDAPARLEFCFAALDGRQRQVQFDLADNDAEAVAKEVYRRLDCAVCLRDAVGNEAQVRLADYCTVYPPLPVKLGKLQYLVGEKEYKAAYQTCLIPVSAFVQANPALNAARLVCLRLVFDDRDGGRVSVDNVGFG